MSNEFIVKNGLIVGGNVVTSGTITINGALAATQSWVTSQAYLTSASLSGYATQSYVTSAIASLVDAAPAALDTLNELAAALGDDASFSTTITNSIASKQSQLNGTGLVRMSGTSVSYDNTTYLVSNFGNIEGDHTYGYPSSEGWYKIAEVVLTSTCQSFNLWGEYRDTGYFDNSHYRIHITARAECDFPTNNENHAINVNIYGSSTNDTYFSNNVRVVLTQSSSNYRKYELQYYRSTWDTGSWRLQTLGWTTYTTSQTAGTPTGTPRVYYVSKFSTDNIFVSNRISIGTTYAGFAANIAGTTYIIGASVWVNDGYGLTNASSGGTGFFPYSDGTLVFNSANSEKMRVASSGNVGIGTNSPGYKLEVNGGATGNNIARFTTGGAGGGTRGLTMYSDNSQVKLQVSDNAGGVGTWAFLNLNPDGGNVGIGTTTPSSLLNIVASGSGSTALTVQDNARKIKIGRDQIEVTDLSDVASTMYLQPNSNLVINGTAGNVGIGSQPSYKLDVNGTIRTQTGYILGANGLADITIDGNIGSQLRYGNQKILLNSADAYIYTNNIARVYVNNTGNVGIGTTSPTEKLHVNGDTRIVGNTYVGGIINAYQGDASIWVPNLGQAFTVKQTTGNVGIGTSSPGYKLEVNGNLASLNSSAAGLFSISGTRSIAIQSFAGDWNYIRSNNANLVFGTQDAANLYIRTNDTDRIFVNTSGKVAIGTSDTNSDKSDFTVYTGSGASLALTDDQVRMGGADVNWGVALRSYGALQTYGQALTLNTQAGNYAVNVQPNGTTVAQFYQDYSYFPGLDFSISRTNGVYSSNYFRGDTSHLVIGTSGTLYLNYGGNTTVITGNTTVSGGLGVSGIASAGARKLSMGILDLNSGITPAQYKIKTSIPWNYGGSDFTVNIKGFRYGTGQMVSLSIGWHYYNNEFYNRTAISNGAWAPTISLAKSSDGYVIIYIPGPDYWPKLYVESVYSSNSADSYTSGWSWSDANLSDCTLIQTVPYGALATNISGNSTTTSQTNFSSLTINSAAVATQAWVGSQGYLTSYTETDTLQSVTNRGGTTTNRLEFQYSVDRYSQAWKNTSTGAYWWVTTDADKLGFHRNGDGDKFYFSNAGDFYSTTNGWLSTALAAKQNASTAITTSNIASQSVSYANSAGEAGQVTNQSGQLLRYDNRTISPSETTAGYLQFGFTSWGNDNSAPYADYLHMRSYTDGSGGTDNLVMFKKSGIGMRIYQQTFASTTPYADYVDVWTTANFTSTNISNWNTAYGWGNHASAGYLTSYSETDTLASVTARGSSTSTAITFNGGVNLAADTGIRKSGDNWIIGYSTSLPGIAIGSGTVTDKVSISSGGIQRVWFDTNGKVGIGTSTPAEELHVIGRGIFNGGSGNSSQDAVVYITKSTNDDWGLYVNNAGLDYGMYTRVSPSANYAFAIHNGTTWTTRITGNAVIYLGEKNAIEGNYDSWLRLNNSSQYASGVYTPGVMRADGGFNVNGSTVWHAGNDGSGSGLDADLLDGQNSTEFLRLLSGGAEASLDSYTDNGFRSVSFAGHSQHLLSWNAGGSTGTVQQLFHYGVPNNGWRIRNKTDNSSWSDWGYVVMASSNQGLISGTIATQSWVGSQSYATTSYVTTQINNLIDAAPGALDTLNELAAALGDDPNFATTVTSSIAGKVSKAGDTMTGALTIQNGVSATWDYMTLEHPGPHARINLGNAENGFLIAHEGTTTATFATNGNLTITGALIETSSIKVKENVETSEGNLEKVVNLRPVTYNKIGSETKELGLIAEEVAEVYPEFVQYYENGEPIGVHYSRLTAALIGAVKELTNQVQELNKKING